MSASDLVRRVAETVEEHQRRRRLNQAVRPAFRAPAARDFASFGDGTLLIEPTRVDGPQYMHLGAGVLVHELAWLIARPDPDGVPPRLVIGDGASILRFAKIVCTGELTIGPGLMTSDHVYISDTEYRHDDPGIPIATQGLAAPRRVQIGANVFLGHNAKVLPGVSIGDGAFVAAGAVVTIDVPERTLAVGNPARIVGSLDA